MTNIKTKNGKEKENHEDHDDEENKNEIESKKADGDHDVVRAMTSRAKEKW